MIRQRMPYWMYSLEELRCDLTAFGEAVELEAEGMAFARNVQYAILFDRIFRFPVTGDRVRNYDGLGGQLLFAYLHRHGFVHWTDNQPDGRVGPPGRGRRRRCAPRSRRSTARASTAPSSPSGAPRTTSSPATCPPAAGSALGRGARAYADVEDPRPYIDDVQPRRVPAAMFYTR